ncbi:MAG: TonB-dependent receptor [Colwellia sp.]|nr:TonB-dependent receptor [Colwellia sp.]
MMKNIPKILLQLIKSCVKLAAIMPIILIIKPLHANTWGYAENNDVAKSEQVEKIERIEVTGSRLKGIDSEFASPVTVISREDIDNSGATRLADVLRASTLNTHGSRRESAGGTAQGQATLNLRGLGEQRTLILINGHRIANSAAIPDAQNINLIPLSAIESIEILKDGASSIYGADAIGGVVNIILRKNIEANHLSLSIVEPSTNGGEEFYAGFYGGITTNVANITYSAEHQKKSAIYARDVKLAQEGLSRYGYPGSYRINARLPETGQLLSKVVADDRCPTALGTSDFPNSVIDNDFCKLNFAQFLQLIPETENSSAMLDGNWQYSNENQLYAHLDFSINKSVGIGAPTPTVGGLEFLPTMSASNINNPTQGQTLAFDSDFDGSDDTFIDGPFDLELFYRNVLGEVRKTENTDKMLNFYAGASGEFLSKKRYQFSIFYNSNHADSLTRGLVRRDLLQAAINDGSFDVFAVNQATSPILAKSFAIDSAFTAKFEYQGANYTLHTNLFGKDASEHDTVFGIEYVEHDYTSVFQDEFADNVIDGRAGGGSAKGQREIFSAFAETSLDVTKLVNLNLSIRYDHYSDFGDTLNPKLGITYRYSPDLIFRASAGTGFRAPSLYELFSNANQSFAYVRDNIRCDAAGDLDNDGTADQHQLVDELASNHPCQPVTVEAVIRGNENLEAESSASYTAGFTYESKQDSRFHLNLYYQYYDNEINLLSNEELLIREKEHNVSGQVIRDQQGELIRILKSYDNFSGTKTAGFDIEYDRSWQTKKYGEFKWITRLSATVFHNVEFIPGEGYEDVSGDLGVSEGQLYTAFKWYKGDWKSQLSLKYYPSMSENNIQLNEYVVANLHIQKVLNKHARISIGALNLFDGTPPNNSALGWPFFYADELFIQGRTLYLDFSYSF